MNKKIEWKIAMITKGITGKQLASELGIYGSAISMVMSGKRSSKRITDYVETRLGLRAKPEPKKEK